MSSKDVVTNQDKLLLALEECETRIMSACRRGREASAAIGKELIKIRDEELFKAKRSDGASYENFTDYVAQEIGIDLTTAYRLMNVYEILFGLEQEGLELPANESQVVALAKLEPETRALVWKRLLIASEREHRDITVETVKLAVEREEKLNSAREAESRPRPATKPKGIKLDLGVEEDEKGNGSTPAPLDVIILSEKGEAALARIRKICGHEAARAIETLLVPISERELIRWAELDTDQVGTLAHYVINQRWSVAKAINFEDKMIDGSTDVDTLVTMCRARGGRLTASHQEAHILVEIGT